MVKFRTAIDSGYKSVVGKIQEFITEAMQSRSQPGVYHLQVRIKVYTLKALLIL